MNNETTTFQKAATLWDEHCQVEYGNTYQADAWLMILQADWINTAKEAA
jgi:hypothetical protein